MHHDGISDQFCLDLCLQIEEEVKSLNRMTLWPLACFHKAVFLRIMWWESYFESRIQWSKFLSA